MTEKSITESGMIFGPYPEEKCFHIEESKTYHQLRSHIKIAEFLLIRNLKDSSPIVWVVEAKSSSPQPNKNIIFDEFIEEIRDKMVSTFNLSIAILLQRHKIEYAALPDPYRELDLSKTGFRFILVIKGHLDTWLPPIQDALQKSLRTIIKTWNLPPTSVAVINDTKAMEMKLVSHVLP